MKKNMKGFTLVEVLIVVIIIAILASLILPRMTAQPEKAIVAEGQQMLGALRRAQQTYMDVTGTAGYVGIPGGGNAGYATLGISAPAASAKFTYACAAGGTNCVATRVGGGAGSTIQLNDDGTYTCGTNYTAVGGNNTKGCTTK